MHLWIERNSNDAVRAFVEKCVASKLSRVSQAVRSIAISLRDVNGPRGGIDHIIRIIVRLTSGGKIVVRHRALDIYAGAPVALERLLQTMTRERGRRRSIRRRAYRRNHLAQTVNSA